MRAKAKQMSHSLQICPMNLKNHSPNAFPQADWSAGREDDLVAHVTCLGIIAMYPTAIPFDTDTTEWHLTDLEHFCVVPYKEQLFQLF